MTDLKLDLLTNDLSIINGNLSITSESTETVAQRLSIKLKLFQGEYFLDTDFGIPYYQTILKKGVNKAIVDGVYKSAIINTPGVVRISSFNSAYSPRTREYRARFSVVADTGETITLEV